VKNDENDGRIPSNEQQSELPQSLHDLMFCLIQTMQDQTEAITRLAESNEALIDAMTQDSGEEGLSNTYMDGSPVR
jgi:hypothetical protein